MTQQKKKERNQKANTNAQLKWEIKMINLYEIGKQLLTISHVWIVVKFMTKRL